MKYKLFHCLFQINDLVVGSRRRWEMRCFDTDCTEYGWLVFPACIWVDCTKFHYPQFGFFPYVSRKIPGMFWRHVVATNSVVAFSRRPPISRQNATFAATLGGSGFNDTSSHIVDTIWHMTPMVFLCSLCLTPWHLLTSIESSSSPKAHKKQRQQRKQQPIKSSQIKSNNFTTINNQQII